MSSKGPPNRKKSLNHKIAVNEDPGGAFDLNTHKC